MTRARKILMSLNERVLGSEAVKSVPHLFLLIRYNDPALDIVRPLLPMCHGSEIIVDWCRNFKEGRTKREHRLFGSNILRQFVVIRNGP